MKNVRSALVAVLLFATLAGCSRSPLLEGAAKTIVTVTLDGAPVDGAAVVFAPEEGNRSATGLTDGAGKADMGTVMPGDGVFPGSYQITVFKSIDDPNGKAQASDEDAARGRYASAPQLYLVPKKYINPRTAKLSAVIEADKVNEVTLALDSK